MTYKLSESPENLPTPEQIGLMISIEPLAQFGKLLQSGALIVSPAEEGELAKASSESAARELRVSLDIGPLETIETIGNKLNMLVVDNAHLADDLLPISQELSGLRRDMAELFQALKSGNTGVLQALIGANAARTDLGDGGQRKRRGPAQE